MGSRPLIERRWEGDGMFGRAAFSPDEKYRYVLERRWETLTPGGAVNFIMLNPSTATEEVLDPTVRRCVGYAKDWGFSRLTVTNLFALRSTDPSALYGEEDPFGEDNLWMIRMHACLSDLVVCAWGNHGTYREADALVLMLLLREVREKVSYLKLTKAGYPGHPLYLKKDLKPTLYWRNNETQN